MHAGLAEVTGTDPRTWPTAALVEALEGLEVAAASVDATRARVLGAFDARAGGAADGAASTVSWLRGHLRVSAREAAVRVRVARALPVLPLVAEALAEGQISHAHAGVITGLARGGSEAGPQALAPIEEQLVAAARVTDPGTLFARTAHLREQLTDRAYDDAAAAADARGAPRPDPVERNRFTAVTGWRGRVHLDGDLDPVGGAELIAALAREEQALFHASTHRAGMTATQRRAAALISLIRRATAAWGTGAAGGTGESGGTGGAATSRGRRPQLVITADVGAVLGQVGAPAARTADGAALAKAALERLVCDPVVTRVLLAGASHVLDLGRATRLFTPAQDTALSVRDGGCVGIDCHQPAYRCDNHHLLSWAAGGATDLTNAAKVCDHDHRLLHEGGWRLHRSTDPALRASWNAAPGDERDTWIWTRPDGKTSTRPVGPDPPITPPDTG